MPADSGAHSPLARITERVERAAACAIEEVETRILVTEAKTSLRARVANVKRVTKKAAAAPEVDASEPPATAAKAKRATTKKTAAEPEAATGEVAS